MNLHLLSSKLNINTSITITGSKSETNRVLLLQALFPKLKLENTSNSDDSEVMLKALSQILEPTTDNSQPTTIDVHHAGTAMRFLTAYFAIQPNHEVVLTGSSRMKERPIHILVEALNSLGAQISYEEKIGFPPLRIKGRALQKSEMDMEANTSSQYISALLLIAPKLENGLKLHLKGEITSLPYIKMTLELLNEIGVETSFESDTITVLPKTHNPKPKNFMIESDWSSASYFYSIVALSEIGTQIRLSSYKENSLQGDSVLAEIYQDFGVKTVFDEHNRMTISKVNCEIQNLQPITYNLQHSPDIAQTIAVTCFGLGLACHLTGLHTLKIKETDRLQALKNELGKLGASVSITSDSISLEASTSIKEKITIKTYQDHRMAMAFAPLALKTSLIIEDAEVVSKSYPDFWNDMKSCGMSIQEII
ncbi:3-phosphoshikimate 1-carboxyvinyltransferase [Flavobacterium sp. SM2513]|uniref:3-phosphoshikimate 1-carboxyvinyltransferase n=1 Tax=Flavobacterium sp. SM2513 TaxID=3424766 RepID=UPI003D7F498C